MLCTGAISVGPMAELIEDAAEGNWLQDRDCDLAAGLGDGQALPVCARPGTTQVATTRKSRQIRGTCFNRSLLFEARLG